MYLASIKKNIMINLTFFLIFSLFTIFVVWSDLYNLFHTYIVRKGTNAAGGLQLVSNGAYIRVGLNIVPAIFMITCV